MANTQDQIIGVLEETAKFFQRANNNLKKCPKERLTKGYIEARIKNIDEYWTTYKQAHQDLVKCTTREQRNVLPYFVKEEFFIQEDIYLNLLATLKDMLTSKTQCENKDNSGSQSSSSSSDYHVNLMAKLPRIQLPTFSGVYEEWPTYQDLFISLVHQDSSLSSVQKLHYLKTSITGEASALLKHIQITESNYSLAWDTLKNRFGNKRLIINSLLKRLFAQRKINIQSAQNIKMLLDSSTEILNSLQNMEISTASWDPILIFLLVQKLDQETQQQWEEFSYKEKPEQLPTWEDLRKFLETKFRTLELTSTPVTTRERTKDKVFHIATNSKQCLKCDGNHTLSHCKDFVKLLHNERSLFVTDKNLCFNCLTPGHAAKKCRAPHTCRICRKRHHSLLHQSSTTSASGQHEPKQPTVSNQSNEEEVQVHTGIDSRDFDEHQSTALLATALVKIMDDYGNTTTVKALVDNGSQASFLSERAAQILRLKRTGINGTITGVGSTRTTVKHATEVHILSRHDTTFKLKIKTYIMPTRLTSQLPARFISTSTWPHLEGLVLADHNFNQPGRVDMLLGVDVCAQIMKGELIKGPPGTPSAQNTNLGWILFGNVLEKIVRDEMITMHLNLDLDNMLKQMWEQNIDEKRLPTAEERKCEEIYKTTTTRSEDGRYIVKLPTKTDNLLSIEGNTRDIALKRLYQLEKRFDRDSSLKKEYVKVMEEYKEMSHMEEVPQEEINKPAIYLPHHAIIKEEKETSKVRTVFNASQKGNNGISLNEELLVGPQLQDDMRSLILRWRMKRICFVADIQKMYRQIHVTKEDSDLQRVLWRKDTDEPVKDYRLLRVTFGTASAPFLAVRTLHQLAEDEGYNHPDAATIIKQDFYMDDLMSGKDTLQEAITTAKEIDSILRKGGFILQKWCSNNAEFLKQFEPSIYAWTDSTIVLSWLLGDPARWNVYVRNRVVEILEEIGNHNWYHVQSQENPADVASRGIPLQDLKHKKMWWKGPEWLQNGEIKFNRPNNITTNLERKEVIHANLKIKVNIESLVRKFENFDNLKELLNVIIYCKRFLKGNKLKDKETAMTTTELDEALKTCIKLVQKESFDEDIKYLRNNKRVKENSKLKFLNPYLDEEDIVRVGGRLRHAEINEESKHPIILDHDTYLSTLLVADAHIKTLHGGPQLMLGYLRAKYWILKAKNLVKLKFRKCLVCAKQTAVVKSQLMGDLPRERVTPNRSFLHSGVNFAGPYQILMSKGRGVRTTKEIGQIVKNVKNDNLPPGKWILGLIVNKHPGPDGVTRVYRRQGR